MNAKQVIKEALEYLDNNERVQEEYNEEMSSQERSEVQANEGYGDSPVTKPELNEAEETNLEYFDFKRLYSIPKEISELVSNAEELIDGTNIAIPVELQEWNTHLQEGIENLEAIYEFLQKKNQ